MPATLPSGRARIVLVGFMGAGKTTVGRHVAEILGWEFVDLDALVAQRAGKPVADIFTDDGEPAFRAHARRPVRGCDHGLAALRAARAAGAHRERRRTPAGRKS
jgi:ATP-dependent exoDNAse (exonuclease V) alpha subunit